MRTPCFKLFLTYGRILCLQKLHILVNQNFDATNVGFYDIYVVACAIPLSLLQNVGKIWAICRHYDTKNRESLWTFIDPWKQIGTRCSGAVGCSSVIEYSRILIWPRSIFFIFSVWCWFSYGMLINSNNVWIWGIIQICKIFARLWQFLLLL